MPADGHAGADTGPCLNCGAPLFGPWCAACGQKGGNHRSLLHLFGELFEALTHADSRVWRTMRRLVLDPGRLTRDFLDGRRASEVPPLRLFLVMLFVLFGINAVQGHAIRIDLQADSREDLRHAIGRIAIPHAAWLSAWLRIRLMHALDHPEHVLDAMHEWLERFTFLMLPVEALLLRLVFLFQRFSLFDHLVFAMHSLSFACVVLSAMFLLGMVVHDVAGLLLLVLPVHLFFHLRGTYCSGRAGTLLRMVPLGLGTMAGSLLLLAGLVALGLELGA